MDLYDFRFSVRFMVGGIAGFAGMTVCMHYAFTVAGGDGRLVVSSVLPFACTLFFFADVRLRPFREFRKGLRIAVPGWDWGRDIATSAVASAIGTGLWLGTAAVLRDLDLTGSSALWIAAGGLMAGTAYLLSWVVCKWLGLFPPPLKPGWGE
jgi:hypothetical protein